MDRPRTIGALKASGYRLESVKEEMRRNLIQAMRSGAPLFPGILGYDETVLPEVQNAILAGHDMLVLGLRGQAKTRMLRMLSRLLDEAIPIIKGSEINDHPFRPSSRAARDRVAAQGDRTEIEWIGPDRRYQEKLATPDVTIADLIGEIDMIKHAEGRPMADELTMHFGLIPRTNRGIFCMNELPDLSPKIQVGLFNVLEERDVQIRGYPIRLELDLCLVFSANPEDYTNRGRIVTPLKDRIGSVIRTHYPPSREVGMAITDANARTRRDGQRSYIPGFMKEIVEEASRQARASPHVNQQSGVSVRMSIANFETMVSSAERRAILLDEPVMVPRISDLAHLGASSRGKLELTMSEEDGQEDKLIQRLVAAAVKVVFEQHFEPAQLRGIVEYFETGKTIEVGDGIPAPRYLDQIDRVPGLKKRVIEFAQKAHPEGFTDRETRDGLIASIAEFILEGLHVNNRLNKNAKPGKVTYRR